MLVNLDPVLLARIQFAFTVSFHIIFPAFTGMTAGVGLSGDLRDPGRSIPLGTLAATIGGMVVYFFITYKLASAASPVRPAKIAAPAPHRPCRKISRRDSR